MTDEAILVSKRNDYISDLITELKSIVFDIHSITQSRYSGCSVLLLRMRIRKD